jgi:hypothetical protein
MDLTALISRGVITKSTAEWRGIFYTASFATKSLLIPEGIRICPDVALVMFLLQNVWP